MIDARLQVLGVRRRAESAMAAQARIRHNLLLSSKDSPAFATLGHLLEPAF